MAQHNLFTFISYGGRQHIELITQLLLRRGKKKKEKTCAFKTNIKNLNYEILGRLG